MYALVAVWAQGRPTFPYDQTSMEQNALIETIRVAAIAARKPETTKGELGSYLEGIVDRLEKEGVSGQRFATQIARIQQRISAFRTNCDRKAQVGDYSGAADQWSQIQALAWVVEYLEKG